MYLCKWYKFENSKEASDDYIYDYDYDYYDDDYDSDLPSERNFPTFTQGGSFADVPQNIQDSLRRLLCPLCVARRFVFNTLSVSECHADMENCPGPIFLV